MTTHSVTTAFEANGIARVTLNNPERHNAFDDRIIAELSAAFTAVSGQPGVRVMVLGSNGKSFSAGADLGWMQRMADYSHAENKRDAGLMAAMFQQLQALPMPTIARVQGAAFGGAVGLVSCCDMAVASDRASFSLSEVRIGLIPATISPYVIQAIGARAASRYFTTAERFSAERARELGLVSEVVTAEQLDVKVDELVKALLHNSPAAVRAAKQLVTDIAGRPVDEQLIADTSERIASIRTSAEGQEGLRAFLEKRPPGWLGEGE
ncbi:enoyl-CoA hydratase/isomerase family protein [Pseudomaricurvus alcaniphilus]|uniref:enoyl-CoA hydratase/isomerase family protein n=1 Tax=Pseudomaricurvus alcaniphilus TaxID=1166482 RepID=UPI00140A80D2|nr:enoyl-CoA hydratase/isomerase family protein [Pseudomaricurvus alcaniphilus]NHN37213.1 enoyl-CoA hydratase/isomerase family protein [Pseudomaricurvus alcaniphilus]